MRVSWRTDDCYNEGDERGYDEEEVCPLGHPILFHGLPRGVTEFETRGRSHRGGALLNKILFQNRKDIARIYDDKTS